MERVRTAKHYWANIWAPIVFGSLTLFYAYIFFSIPDVRYRTSDSGWADYEVNFRGRNFERIVYNYEGYKLICDAPDAKLYRTTQKNWLNIFAWQNYFSDRKWHVPYAPPDPKIGYYYPHYDQLKHCYNGEWPPELLDETKKNTERYLREFDKKVAAARR